MKLCIRGQFQVWPPVILACEIPPAPPKIALTQRSDQSGHLLTKQRLLVDQVFFFGVTIIDQRS